MKEYTVLLIEMDKAVQKLIKHNLSIEHYQVLQAENGLAGLSLFDRRNPEVILMDLELPDMNGLKVLNQIRQNSEIPIIIVSARDSKKDIITALDCGADDYVIKPFNMEELKARIRAHLRRGQDSVMKQKNVYTADYLTLDFEKRKVYIHGKSVHLTPLEYKLLILLVANRGKVLTYRYIQQQLWGRNKDGDCKYQVYMSHVRKKINDNAKIPQFIRTEKGVGYRFLEK